MATEAAAILPVSETIAAAASHGGKLPLLYGCAFALLAMVQRAYSRLEQTHGPVGSLASKLSSIVTPVSYRLQRPLLSLVFFADYCLLAVEDVVGSIFPPSKRMFGKMHGLVEALSSALPAKIDGLVDVLQWVVARFPFLDSVVEKGAASVDWVLEVVGDWPTGEERVIRVVEDNEGMVLDAEESPESPQRGSMVAVEEEEEKHKAVVEREGSDQKDFPAEEKEEEEEETILQLLEGWHSSRPRRRT